MKYNNSIRFNRGNIQEMYNSRTMMQKNTIVLQYNTKLL